MTSNATIESRIERAAETVGSAWPAHSFVTANPLAGFEDRPFHRAVEEAESLFGGRGYPRPAVFEQAWEEGRIDGDVLRSELEAHGIDREPAELLAEMAERDAERERGGETAPETETLDQVTSKWLAAFLDEGRANWSMPDREKGFYAAWRGLAPHDDEIPGCERASDLPEAPTAALESVLDGVPEDRWEGVFEHHLAALPGWTGFIKRRERADADPWQEAAPISLTEYLAVRLVTADLLDAPVVPEDPATDTGWNDGPERPPLPELWLSAWEKSYRRRLLDEVGEPDHRSHEERSESDERPDAQLVFCIDARSEVIRRHVEAQGDYETHGYAGSFGVPMRYRPHGSRAEFDSCPPVAEAQHRVPERPEPGRQEDAAAHERWRGLAKAGRKHLKSLKRNAAAAFTFVEGAGSAYGAAMTTRTLLPNIAYDIEEAIDQFVPDPASFCAPALEHHSGSDEDLPRGLSLGERVAYAETAFELMGIEEFARLVVFTGHASQTANNPFGSSLDCGACAGNPGGQNARVLAAICDDDEVVSALRERGYDIPEDTVFLAAEHNTTTDEITLFDDDDVPASHRSDVEELRADLAAASERAASERAESLPGTASEGAREVERRAADWAETRPEWGLAGNAAFVIGPRDLTAGRDLDGRAFLHSYNWERDPEGESLEAIVTGPLVVTQWINSQYYFASVDNAVYGSGSKTTQNPVGNVGVRQGNGGDLMTGLPRQSLYAADDEPYHQPLRLTAVIQAPVERVSAVLRRNDELVELLDNGWFNLTVLDPTTENGPVHYAGGLSWEPARDERTEPAATVATRGNATPDGTAD